MINTRNYLSNYVSSHGIRATNLIFRLDIFDVQNLQFDFRLPDSRNHEPTTLDLLTQRRCQELLQRLLDKRSLPMIYQLVLILERLPLSRYSIGETMMNEHKISE